MSNDAIHAALLTWFAEYSELGDLCAEQAESLDDDPTLADAILTQLETCVSVAASIIPLLGKHALTAADPTATLTSDGTEYVKPPF